MNLTTSFPFILIATLFFACCSDDDDGHRIDDFDSVKLFDQQGSPIGCHPTPCDDDWTWQQLEDHEMDLLNFPDTIDILTLASKGTAERVAPYPIPLSRNGGMSFSIKGDSNIKVKMALVNQEFDNLSTWSFRTNSSFHNINLSEMVFSQVPDSTRARIYYRIYNREGATDLMGYGDISICPEGAGANYIEDCF